MKMHWNALVVLRKKVNPAAEELIYSDSELLAACGVYK